MILKISVIGLGRAGLPLASVIADAGFQVLGIDLDKERCKQINNRESTFVDEPGLNDLIKKHGGKNLIATSDYMDAKDCNFYIVVVPLLIDNEHNPDFKYLKSAFRNIGGILKKGDCVVLETTVPPKTTEDKIKKWLEEESGLAAGDFYLAHSPERIMTGYSISRLMEFPKIIGGVDKQSGEKVFDVYKKFIPNMSLVSSSRVAEFIKVIEGCYRSTNIALANELFKISDELDIDFFEARKHANHEYCDIHMPSTGVGGHCIPVYPWFLVKEMEQQGKSDYSMLQQASLKINDEMINFWADKIINECMKIDKPLNEVKICVNGITFRKSVKSLYNSRNLALVKLLIKKGLNVFVYDELYPRNEIIMRDLKFARPTEADIIFDSFLPDMVKVKK